MTYPLSPEEFQTTLAQDAEQRYHHFLQQAVLHNEVWILKDVKILIFFMRRFLSRLMLAARFIQFCTIA